MSTYLTLLSSGPSKLDCQNPLSALSSRVQLDRPLSRCSSLPLFTPLSGSAAPLWPYPPPPSRLPAPKPSTWTTATILCLSWSSFPTPIPRLARSHAATGSTARAAPFVTTDSHSKTSAHKPRQKLKILVTPRVEGKFPLSILISYDHS